VAAKPESRVDTVVSLAKRRGFVYPCGEIYGGTRSAWDYGPLGVELKENIKRQWWRSMVTGRDDVVGLDSSVILPKKTWEASGHVATFSDPLTECQSCHRRFRADHLEEEFEERKGRAPENGLADIACPNCGTRGAGPPPRQFNGLLKTYLGPVEDESGLHYLRPRRAGHLRQLRQRDEQPPARSRRSASARSARASATRSRPGNFIFRTREFEQMEMEFFVEPGTDEQWHQYWIDARTAGTSTSGSTRPTCALRAPEGEAVALLDAHCRHRVPLRLPGSQWGELEGIANRTDFDLKTPLGALGRRPVVLRPGQERALDAVRHRAGRRPEPGR
jgi:glycyl-tRNA synthetase